MNTTQTRLALLLTLALGGTASASTVTLFDSTTLGPGAGSAGIAPVGSYFGQMFKTLGNCPDGCLLGNISLTLNAGDLDLTDTSGFKLEVLNSEVPPGTTVPAPGTVVIQEYINPASVPGGGITPSVFTPELPPAILANNTDYWVILTSLASTPDLAWEWPADMGSGAYHWIESRPGDAVLIGEGYGFGMVVEAEQLAPVPVPAAVWLMGTALAGLAMRAKKAA